MGKDIWESGTINPSVVIETAKVIIKFKREYSIGAIRSNLMVDRDKSSLSSNSSHVFIPIRHKEYSKVALPISSQCDTIALIKKVGGMPTYLNVGDLVPEKKMRGYIRIIRAAIAGLKAANSSDSALRMKWKGKQVFKE